MIISVPSSLNLSHNSFVSRKQSTYFNSSQLHFAFIIRPFSFSFFLGGLFEVEEELSLPEGLSSLLLVDIWFPGDTEECGKPFEEFFTDLILIDAQDKNKHLKIIFETAVSSN